MRMGIVKLGDSDLSWDNDVDGGAEDDDIGDKDDDRKLVVLGWASRS